MLSLFTSLLNPCRIRHTIYQSIKFSCAFFPAVKVVQFCFIISLFYQRSRRVPRLTDWIRRAVNAWGMDIGSEKLISFSDR